MTFIAHGQQETLKHERDTEEGLQQERQCQFPLNPYCTRDHVWRSERMSPRRNVDTWHMYSGRLGATKVLQGPGQETKHRTGDDSDIMKLGYPEALMQHPRTQ